ncbi:MAG: cellulase family glycosylhydrolase [Acidobacteriota bacterium]
MSPARARKSPVVVEDSHPIHFWDEQRKGANFFNRVPARERFQSATELGLEFIRLVPDKWKTGQKDFLIGSADRYEGLAEPDLKKLIAVLDDAAALGHHVVLGMLGLPGARWSQSNQGKDDYRLWNEDTFQQQAIRFWKDLAKRLRGHPAIAAYDPLNEPHPAREHGIDGAEDEAFADWRKRALGTAADLDRFNRRIVFAIREVDPTTPILLEGYGYGSAAGLSYLTPVDDSDILYSFHFYEPWQYTTTRVNAGRYRYPDAMPDFWNAPPRAWTRDDLKHRIQPVLDWAARHRIPANRIVAAEFGCGRRSPGAVQYLADVMAMLNEGGFHWAFYSYREDTWDSMDYELGTGARAPGGWQLLERGEYRIKRWSDNPLFEVLKREFRSK